MRFGLVITALLMALTAAFLLWLPLLMLLPLRLLLLLRIGLLPILRLRTLRLWLRRLKRLALLLFRLFPLILGLLLGPWRAAARLRLGRGSILLFLTRLRLISRLVLGLLRLATSTRGWRLRLFFLARGFALFILLHRELLILWTWLQNLLDERFHRPA
jgi:hypothetical protein